MEKERSFYPRSGLSAGRKTKHADMKKNHEIIDRKKIYVSDDAYGYEALCSCGKRLFGWSAEETEKKAKEHAKEL